MIIDRYMDDILSDGEDTIVEEEKVDIKELTDVLTMKIENTITQKLDEALKKVEDKKEEDKKDGSEDNSNRDTNSNSIKGETKSDESEGDEGKNE